MAKSKKLQASDLIGLFIYHDPKLGTIFYDVFTKKAFQLINRDVRAYNIYTAMLPLCAVLAFISYSWFGLSTAWAFVVFVALWIISEIVARYVFFYKLPEAKNWKKFKKESMITSLAKNYTGLRLLVLTGLLVTISIVTVWNARIENYTGANLYGSYAVSAGAAVFAVIALISYVVKRTKKL